MTDADDFPTDEFGEEWAQVKRHNDMSQHDRLGELLAAAADEDTLLGVAQRARLTREHTRAALSWFGLADSTAGAHEWPVEWREDAIETLQSGELPEQARARAWRVEQ